MAISNNEIIAMMLYLEEKKLKFEENKVMGYYDHDLLNEINNLKDMIHYTTEDSFLMARFCPLQGK